MTSEIRSAIRNLRQMLSDEWDVTVDAVVLHANTSGGTAFLTLCYDFAGDRAYSIRQGSVQRTDGGEALVWAEHSHAATEDVAKKTFLKVCGERICE